MAKTPKPPAHRPCSTCGVPVVYATLPEGGEAPIDVHAPQYRLVANAGNETFRAEVVARNGYPVHTCGEKGGQ